MVFQERFSAEVLMDFLEWLIRQGPRKVFLSVDAHPVHRSAKVKAWVARKPKSMRLFFLFGYSPELNPDEMLNQDVKNNAVSVLMIKKA
jgi:hypothetical protein